ncbi:MAG: hypothetical protein JWN29_2879 [Acidimicrobiales bacterium]|jgi:hypothetical protein|nr:hypothetical protein [Acidimicrobiales bacterium]
MTATRAHPEFYGLRGVVHLWFPLVAPIAAWTVHILYISSIARFTCTEPTTTWTIHAVTAATLAVCGVAMLLAWRVTKGSAAEHEDEVEDDVVGRHLFLGRLALVIGAINVIVIILEELYAIGFHPVRCV